MATIKELANNPSSVSISKFEKEFEFDSLYVAKFTYLSKILQSVVGRC